MIHDVRSESAKSIMDVISHDSKSDSERKHLATIFILLVLRGYNIEFSARSESEPRLPTITDEIPGPRQCQNGALQRFVRWSMFACHSQFLKL